ncbi:MAG: hypothetical protein JSW27_08790 [Phycisphaerales bacterium]|nr:MAG: hypothetical protein JSW27_08790 [Phycisphaerales bacterium]
MQQEDQVNMGKHARRIRWRRWIAVALAVLVLVLVLHCLRPTAEEQLAAFDAARAVPDDDNAALIYAELLRGEKVPVSALWTQLAPFMESIQHPVSWLESRELMKEVAELELPEGLLDPNGESLTLWEPWTSATCPELRRWLDHHSDRIDRLLEAAQKPACYFPLRPEPNDMGLFDVPLGTLGQCVALLRRAANNDMGEGNVAAGLKKYQAVTSIGRHLSKQPAKMPLIIGIPIEGVGLQHLAQFIATGPATERHLDALAIDGSNLENQWDTLSEDVSRVRNILARAVKDHRRLDLRIYEAYRRIRYHEDGWVGKSRTRDLYQRVLCQRRAHHILIELRRFKNRAGHWPDQIDEIASSVVPLALIDPQNGGAYVYRRTEDGFRLYSTGPNGRDENGQRQAGGPDDWPLWPTYSVLAGQRPKKSAAGRSRRMKQLNPVPSLPPLNQTMRC